MIDFHSHFLPKVDDGSRSSDESEKLLRFLAGVGVTDVCATPHYIMHNESIETFLERRNGSYERFSEKKDTSAMPHIRLGAEVKVERGLSQVDSLAKLCCQDSDRVLFEFPFKAYEGWMTEEIYNACYRHNIKPVIAHLNRYFNAFTQEQINDILSIDNVIIQINAESFESIFTVPKIKKLIEGGSSVVYGYDIHHESNILQSEKNAAKLNKFLLKYPQQSAEHEFFAR